MHLSLISLENYRFSSGRRRHNSNHPNTNLRASHSQYISVCSILPLEAIDAGSNGRRVRWRSGTRMLGRSDRRGGGGGRSCTAARICGWVKQNVLKANQKQDSVGIIRSKDRHDVVRRLAGNNHFNLILVSKSLAGK